MNDEDAIKKIRYQRAQAEQQRADAAERVMTAEANAKQPQQPEPMM